MRLCFHDTLTNSCNKYSVKITTGHTNNYRFEKLILIIQMNYEKNILMDTLIIPVKTGIFEHKGNGWGSNYDYTIDAGKIAFSNTASVNREFSINISHGMPEEELKGINYIGVKLTGIK